MTPSASAAGTSATGPALICYDGSSDAGNAIEEAGELLGGGRALVLYLWMPPSALLLAGRIVAEDHPLGPAITEFDSTAQEEAEKVAAEGVALASRAGFDATPRVERASHGIWRAIVRIAEEEDARVVVVGSHGRSLASSAVLGSVSHGVVNHCKRPVLLAPCTGDHAQVTA